MATLILTNIVSLWFIYDKNMFENNYESAEVVVSESEKYINAVNPELIIAHKGLDKFMEITIQRDILGWAPDDDMNTKNIYRYVYNITKNEIN